MTVQTTHRYFVHVTGVDCPGVVGDVCQRLEALNGHVASFRKTTMEELFALTLVVELPSRWKPSPLCERLTRQGSLETRYSITAYLAEEIEAVDSTERRSRYVVTVFGEDGPAVLERLDSCLAAKRVLITELCGECDGEEFVLVAHVDATADCFDRFLRTELEKLAEELKCHIKVEDFDVFHACGLPISAPSPDGHVEKSRLVHHVPSAS